MKSSYASFIMCPGIRNSFEMNNNLKSKDKNYYGAFQFMFFYGIVFDRSNNNSNNTNMD